MNLRKSSCDYCRITDEETEAPGKVNELLGVTQPVSPGSQVRTPSVWLQSLTLNHYSSAASEMEQNCGLLFSELCGPVLPPA